MTKPEILKRLLDPGIVAIIRADSPHQLVAAAEALLAGGIKVIEVTMTTPNALEVITAVCRRLGQQVIMGVGSVLDTETARAAILAGAEFVVTPVTKPDVIQLCNRYSKPVICGAFTPTEALLAHESGADFVKIFPAEQLGPDYIKSLLVPLPMLQLMPVGGVSAETAGAYLKAGAVALGVGANLVSKEILKKADWAALRTAARSIVSAVKKARA